MRRLMILLGLLLGATALLAGCSSSSSSTASSSSSSTAVQDVAPQEFLSASSQPGTVVVDVRTPAEYAAGHVDGAVNIDVESADFGTQIAALPKDSTYAVYCRSGRRSGIATSQMSDSGFTSLINLDGGVADLQAAGAPIVSG